MMESHIVFHPDSFRNALNMHDDVWSTAKDRYSKGRKLHRRKKHPLHTHNLHAQVRTIITPEIRVLRFSFYITFQKSINKAYNECN